MRCSHGHCGLRSRFTTGNLDPANRGHVLDVLIGYAERTGATLVSVTHDHELLARFDRIVDLEQFHGSPEGGQ